MAVDHFVLEKENDQEHYITLCHSFFSTKFQDKGIVYQLKAEKNIWTQNT